MKDDYVPTTFRGALESGQIGPWLKRQIIWLAIFAAAVAAFWVYAKLSGKI